MAAYILKASLLIQLICLVDSRSIIKPNIHLLNATLNAVDRALSFYTTNYMNVNLDGIFGLRILQGQLSVVIDQYSGMSSGNKADTDLILRLKRMQTEAKRISDSSLASIQAYQPEYYKIMGQVVREPFIYAKPFKRINASLRRNLSVVQRSESLNRTSRSEVERKGMSAGMSMTEEVSDRCIEELLGRGGVERRGACSEVSIMCVEVMTRPGLRDFDITHQLIYIMFAYLNNCTEAVSKAVRKINRGDDLNQIQDLLCTGNFFEVSEAVRLQNGLILPRLQDLFLEQQFVCAMAGYMEFLHSDWLRQIISWQRANGCWGQMKKSGRTRNLLNDDYDYLDKIDNSTRDQSALPISQDLKNNVNNLQHNSFKDNANIAQGVQDINRGLGTVQNLNGNRYVGRKLLYDRVLSDGCLSHKTAVAMGALSQYLRILLSPSGEILYGVNHLMNPDKLTNQYNPNPVRTSDILKTGQRKEETSPSFTSTLVDNSLSSSTGRKLSNTSDQVTRRVIVNDGDVGQQDDDDDDVDDDRAGGEVSRRDEDLNNDYLEEENEENLDGGNQGYGPAEDGMRDNQNKDEPGQEDEQRQDEGDYAGDKGVQAGDKDADEGTDGDDYARNSDTDYRQNAKDKHVERIQHVEPRLTQHVVPVDPNRQEYDDISILRGRGRPGGLDLPDPALRFADIPNSLQEMNSGSQYSSVPLLYVLVTSAMIVGIIVLYRFTRRRRSSSLFYHRRM